MRIFAHCLRTTKNIFGRDLILEDHNDKDAATQNFIIFEIISRPLFQPATLQTLPIGLNVLLTCSLHYQFV